MMPPLASARPRAFPRHAGDVLTAFRIAATPLFAALVCTAAERPAVGWVAGGLFAAIAASDFADGRLARRAGAVRSAGRVLDHGADIFFLLSALTSYVLLGVAPWWVPAAMAASFAAYVLDAYRPSSHPSLGPSRLGHYGGVLNYALVGVLVYNESTGLRLLPPWLLTIAFGLVPLYSAAAIVERRWSSAP
jgi:phosphatidylglycerophosphate synthase